MENTNVGHGNTMPFTPYHMGPGMLLKAAAPDRFSIVVFGLTQVAIDMEALWYLIRWDLPIHRFWHTYLGATVVFAVFALVGKPASQTVKSAWNRCTTFFGHRELNVPEHTSWLAAFTGAVVGSYSHVLLDSMYSYDMTPMQPWNDRNPLLGLVGPTWLIVLCVFLGVLGIGGYLERRIRRQE